MGIAPDELTAIVAAGGSSSRFGRDKAGYRVAGVPLLERTVGIAAGVASQVLVALPGPSSDEPAYWAEARSRWPHIEDASEAQGPAAALLAGVRACRRAWLLLLPTDLPHLTVAALEQLVASADTLPVVARDATGRMHPTVCLVPATRFAALEALILDGERAMHRLLTGIGAISELVSGAALHNMNRPGDAP